MQSPSSQSPKQLSSLAYFQHEIHIRVVGLYLRASTRPSGILYSQEIQWVHHCAFLHAHQLCSEMKYALPQVS